MVLDGRELIGFIYRVEEDSFGLLLREVWCLGHRPSRWHGSSIARMFGAKH